MTPQEEEKQREADEEVNFMDDEDEEPEIMGYFCLGCNHSQSKKPDWGGQCPKCGTHMEEEYF